MADDALRGDLANSTDPTKGASLVGFDGGQVSDLLENLISLTDYSSLRSYSGIGKGVILQRSDISGTFRLDPQDTTTADNGGTVIVDSLGRRWIRSFGGPSQLRWFEPAGDGVADDTNKLLAWLNSYQNLEGCAGTYRVTGRMNLDGALTRTLRLDGKSMLVVHDSADTQEIFRFNRFLHPEVRGMRIDGKKELKPVGNSQSIGLNFYDCVAPIVENNYVTNCQEHGIVIYYQLAHVTDGNGSHACVVNNFVEDCGTEVSERGNGIWLFGDMIGNVVSNNRVSGCQEGIAIDDSSDDGPLRINEKNVMSGNVVTARNYACRYETGHESSITGNVFICTGSPNYAVRNGIGLMFRAIQHADIPTGPGAISGNYIKAPRTGVELASVRYVNVSGNMIIQSNDGNEVRTTRPQSAIDIYVWNQNLIPCDNLLITGNHILSEGNGFYIGGLPPTGNPLVDNVNITNNVIKQIGADPGVANLAGIRTQYVSNIGIHNNQISNYLYGVQMFAGPGGTVDQLTSICDNVMRECGTAVSIGYGHGVLVRANTTHKSTTASISFYSGAASSKSVCMDNVMFDFSVTGSGIQTPRANTLVTI